MSVEFPLPLARRTPKLFGLVVMQRSEMWIALFIFALLGFVLGVLSGMQLAEPKRNRVVEEGDRR